MKYLLLPFLGFTSWLVGCGPVVDTTSTSASSSGSGGAGASGGGGVGGSGGSSGVGGFGAGPSAPCVPLTKPSMPTVPLCGPGDAPCQVLHEEVLPVPPAYRNDAPALLLDPTCQPRILFSTAVGEYKGFYGVRGAEGGWEVSPTPFAMATGGLVSIAPDLPVALANDGAFGASLWSFSAGGWNLVEDVPAEGTHFGRGFALAKTGELFAGFRGPGDEYLFGRYGSSWNIETLGGTPTPPAVAVSPEGKPHLIAWEAKNGAWELHWRAPPLPSEQALAVSGSLQADVMRPALAVTAADAQNPEGKPHILALRTLQNFSAEVVYVTREGQDTWAVTVLEQVSPDERVYLLGIVTDEAGAVRLFYSRTNPAAPAAGRLIVASPHSDVGIPSAIVTEGFSPYGATFERDGSGRIHVALYELGLSSDVDIRYMVLGP